MFEEFSLTSPTKQKTELPEIIRIGDFQRKTAKVPVILPINVLNGLCFETNAETQESALNQMQYMALDLIKRLSREVLRLTFVDIGLNTNFPILHSLNFPNIKFITNRNNLKNGVDSLFETARYVSTKCLGGEFGNLGEYNKQASYKEPYNFLFIANFPKEFREEEIDAVSMLINEGSKCGIQVIMNLDKAYFPEINSYNQSHFAKLYALYKQITYINCTKPMAELNNFDVKIIQDWFTKYPFKFENYSQKELSTLITNLNDVSDEQDNVFTNFISIPIGRNGRNEVNFEMGEKADVYHGLIAGASRSGKSTLLNNIITNIADKYSPDELRLYLLDYKEGVEFQIYENHPNVELLLLDNGNFCVGIDALKQFRDEINKRSKLFKELSPVISNINEYNKKAKEKIPRMLLIIDEVQQLFLNYQSSREVNLLVKDIARLGGAFGIHLLFCSQSYMNTQIADDIMSQMGLRISYRLANGQECRAILGRDNDAPIKLERFQMVYNDHFGDKDYNLLIKASNFDKEKIIPTLRAATKKHKGSKPFKKRIITEETEILKKENKFSTNDIVEIKTTKREIIYNKDDYGF
jgi:hypothetical protein